MSNQWHYMQEESDAYIQEIESIGAAYEDMQGQNTRLLAQLADNDRVNNDLVAERVKVGTKVQETEKVFTEQTFKCEISHGGCWRCWPTVSNDLVACLRLKVRARTRTSASRRRETLDRNKPIINPMLAQLAVQACSENDLATFTRGLRWIEV